MKNVTFDPRHDAEKKVLYIAVLIDGAWAAEIWHDDVAVQDGGAMHVTLPNGTHPFGGNKWEPKTLWDCRRWCQGAVAGGILRAAARPMTQDEKDDTIITR